ncbi:MAG: type II toxin-antitoxin system HicA family toxin [Deltaproteobacteria bacterium]|nr:type II toxin-antitoxin system HicA family toxin [Deltaproteobacteria bacterium]
MQKLAEQFGYAVKPGAGKGSHIRMEKPGAHPVTIPSNRESLSPGVLKSTLASLGGYRLADIPTLRSKL